jgi:hypothetical protein
VLATGLCSAVVLKVHYKAHYYNPPRMLAVACTLPRQAPATRQAVRSTHTRPKLSARSPTAARSCTRRARLRGPVQWNMCCARGPVGCVEGKVQGGQGPHGQLPGVSSLPHKLSHSIAAVPCLPLTQCARLALGVRALALDSCSTRLRCANKRCWFLNTSCTAAPVLDAFQQPPRQHTAAAARPKSRARCRPAACAQQRTSVRTRTHAHNLTRQQLSMQTKH